MFDTRPRLIYFLGALLLTAGVLLICLFAPPPAAAATACLCAGGVAAALCAQKRGAANTHIGKALTAGLLFGAGLPPGLSALNKESLPALLTLTLIPLFSSLAGIIRDKGTFHPARLLCLLGTLAGAALGYARAGLSLEAALAAMLIGTAVTLYGTRPVPPTRKSALLFAGAAMAGALCAALVIKAAFLPLPDTPLWWLGPICAGTGYALMQRAPLPAEDAVWLRAAAPLLPLLVCGPKGLRDSDALLFAGFLMPAGGALLRRFTHAPARYKTGEERLLLKDTVPVSLYNGVLCLRHPFQRLTSAANFWFILLNGNRGRDRRYHAGTDTVRHEYGHIRQARALGPLRYWRYIALPSLRGYINKVPYADYYNQPWERGADRFGGVERTVHKEGSLQTWNSYFMRALPKRKRNSFKKEGKNMIKFLSDYQEGACPEIMEALQKTNYEQSEGYGEDAHCAHARSLIKAACGREDADVHFLIGGTSCNKILISAALRPFEGALCVTSAHINAHETGTVEASGHKVLALPSPDGKLTARQIEETMAAHWADETHEHIVRPGLVYITYPTEGGLLYTLDELKAIRAACDKWSLYLYLDGARLGYGLAAKGGDVTLQDIARLTDAFYIGGTKVGALFGEAMVLLHPALKKDFRYMIKNQGGLLAKGRLQGVQFETLFSDGLYQRIAAHAVEQAMRIRDTLKQKGIPVLYDSPTNQQFPLLTPAQYDALKEKYAFESWGPDVDGRKPVRFCTSWATRPEHVDTLLADILAL